MPSPSYIYYQLYDPSGAVKVLKRNSFVSASSPYVGRVDTSLLFPSNSVKAIVKAIARQEDCDGTLEAAGANLHVSRTANAPLAGDTVPPGMGSKQTNAVVVLFEGEISPERERRGSVLTPERNAVRRPTLPDAGARRNSLPDAGAPPAYNAVVFELSGTWTWDSSINESGDQSIQSKGNITFEPGAVHSATHGVRKQYTGHGSSTFYDARGCDQPPPSFALEILKCAVDGNRISFAWKRNDGFIWDFSGTWVDGRTFTGSGKLRGMDGASEMTFRKQ